MTTHRSLGGNIFTLPFMVLGVFAVIGLGLLADRFANGLGAVTHLNNGYPWGIWVAWDIVVGTALACGGYALAIMVYVANRGEYHPLVRPALMASLFGYSLGAFSALFDMGRWWQAYNIFLPWNINLNSVMLEVGLCVAAYTLVLLIEFSPAFLEKLRDWGKVERLNRVLFVFIALGILLPTMHQSSLGSMLILAGHKVGVLWQTQLLPVLFLISALVMGLSMVMFEASLMRVGMRQPDETSMLARLTPTVIGLLSVYLGLRVLDLLVRGQIGAAFAFDRASVMFWVETVLFVYPLYALLRQKTEPDARRLFLAACSLLAAGALYRLNAYLIGFDPGDGYIYFPSVSEILVTLGIISIEIMAYLVFVKTLPVLHSAAPSAGSTPKV